VSDEKLESGVLAISWLLEGLTSMICLSLRFFLKLLVAEQLYDLIETLDADELCLSSVVDSVDESGRGDGGWELPGDEEATDEAAEDREMTRRGEICAFPDNIDTGFDFVLNDVILGGSEPQAVCLGGANTSSLTKEDYI